MARSPQVAVRDLFFTHDRASRPLFDGLTASFPSGFTGIVGANGCGKTTLLELLVGLRSPDAGEVSSPGLAVYCPQRTDSAPDGLDEFLAGEDADSWVLRGRLGVEADFAERWSSLSHGERKRAQIATALWRAPDLLAIDEPTNHVDGEARDLLEAALANHRGVGVLVSHDRTLLDGLCSQCLWLERSRARLVPGGYTKGRAVLEEARSAAVHAHENARRDRDRLAREVVRRREEAAGSARRLSKRGIGAKDHDAKRRIDAARLTGKGTAAGKRLHALDGHVARADACVQAKRVDKRYATGVQLLAERSRRDAVLSAEAGTLELGAGRVLHYPELRVAPDDRIALTGPNGAGKSTLLRHLMGMLDAAAVRCLYIAQELTADRAAEELDAVRRLRSDRLGTVMQFVSRLGSRPEALLDSSQPSPGEARKLALARGLLEAPQLVVMDEPTNHLDLPSVEALEEALAEVDCALLLASHDRRFLERLARTEWKLVVEGADTRLTSGPLEAPVQ
ncbi:MAG: ATP-binding cassette domain-containing protein [Pseudomonadales bacterium]|jgi:ATPase subunit of ABC transporter with duplicated ATPase domains|nr:ATP-binding cassette domain-containing protein [Pseudomonadales bacterium]